MRVFQGIVSSPFCIANAEVPLEELIMLLQTWAVEENISKFQSLLVRITTVCADQQVDIFSIGLPLSIHLDVEIHRPTYLVSAMSLAIAFEKKL